MFFFPHVQIKRPGHHFSGSSYCWMIIRDMFSLFLMSNLKKKAFGPQSVIYENLKPRIYFKDIGICSKQVRKGNRLRAGT